MYRGISYSKNASVRVLLHRLCSRIITQIARRRGRCSISTLTGHFLSPSNKPTEEPEIPRGWGNKATQWNQLVTVLAPMTRVRAEPPEPPHNKNQIGIALVHGAGTHHFFFKLVTEVPSIVHREYT